MGSKLHFSFLFCVLSFAVATLFACEDNPEECYSDEDCGDGYLCEPTYYNSGSRSGGVCHEIEAEKDGGDDDASGETQKTEDAAIQDSAQSSSVDEASTDAATPVDAAEEDALLEAAVSEAAVDAAVEGGQSPQPVDGGNVDSAN